MKYGKLSCTELYWVAINSNASQLTYSLIGPLAGGQKGSMNQGLSILSPKSFFIIGSLVLSGTQHGVKVPCGIAHDRAGFFENNIFVPKMDQK